MRLFAIRVVLMLTFAILAVSAISAGLAVQQGQDAGGNTTYMTIVCTVSALLVAVALWLTRGQRDVDETFVPPESV